MTYKYLFFAAVCLLALPLSAQTIEYPAGCPDPQGTAADFPQLFGGIQLDNAGVNIGDVVGVYVNGGLVGRSTVFNQQIDAMTFITAANTKLQDKVETDDNGMPCPIFVPGDEVELKLLSGGVIYDATNGVFDGTVTGDNLDGADGDVSEFDIYTFLTSLPVSLVDFTATPNDQQVNLNWATSEETDNSHFEIERSANPESGFENIGKVLGNATTGAFNNYAFTDEVPTSGVNYYRLRQVDFDGGFEYSAVISVEMNISSDRQLAVFPNPAASNGRLTINLQGDWAKGTTEIRLVDAAGRLVNEWKNVTVGSTNTQLPALPAGMYQLIAKDEQEQKAVRLMVR